MFPVIDKDAGRKVHTYEMKLRLLNLKVKDNFLVAMKMNIEMQMNMVPMSVTYASAFINYRNTVDNKIPHTAINNTRTCQRVQHTNTGYGVK